MNKTEETLYKSHLIQRYIDLDFIDDAYVEGIVLLVDKIFELHKGETASLQSDLLSLNSNLLTMAENVDLVVKERDRYKGALGKCLEAMEPLMEMAYIEELENKTESETFKLLVMLKYYINNALQP